VTDTLPWRETAGGLTIHVRLTPKGGRDGLDGIETMSDGRAVLKARVRAVPEDGKANEALVALIAKCAGVSKSAVALTAGHTSRVKTLTVAGDPARIAAAVSAAFKR